MKPFTKKQLQEQVDQTTSEINKLAVEIQQKTQALEQSRGVLSYAQFLLSNYELPEEVKADESPVEPSK